MGWDDMFIRVEEPKHGGWFCFDRIIRVPTAGNHERRYTDIEDDSHWYGRVWHKIARPFRRWFRR